MVLLTRILCQSERLRFRRRFLDSLRLHVKGGSGGMGLPKYGGIGGDGGNIYVKGKEGITLKDTFKQFRSKRIQADNGTNSARSCILGLNGEDVIIECPVGVTVLSETEKLGEINSDGETVLAAKGGRGGRPENDFCGRRGDSYSVVLDLKIIADVGLVGFPNAGKSTLLSAVSNAKPKIASYPFTTIQPNLGVMEYKDLRSISMADLPGLIEGAHVNIGMGHKFLKHVERTKLLLFVVDVSGFQLSPRHQPRSCLETILLLNKELELYREDLLDKPAVLVVNKMDTVTSPDRVFDDIRRAIADPEGLMSQVEAAWRPSRLVEFESMLALRLAQRLPEEVEALKTAIRTVLDSTVEEKVPDLPRYIPRPVAGPMMV